MFKGFGDTLKHPFVLTIMALNVIGVFAPRLVLKISRYAIPVLILSSLAARSAEMNGKLGVYRGFKISTLLDSLLISFALQAAFIKDSVLVQGVNATTDPTGRKILRGSVSLLAAAVYLHWNKSGDSSLNSPKTIEASNGLPFLEGQTHSANSNPLGVRMRNGEFLTLTSRQRNKAILRNLVA